MELRADKLLVLTGQDVRDLNLPHYLPLVSGGSGGSSPGWRQWRDLTREKAGRLDITLFLLRPNRAWLRPAWLRPACGWATTSTLEGSYARCTAVPAGRCSGDDDRKRVW